MTSSALSLREIEVRAGGRVTLALPSLTVARGETLAIVGPNGAGKSTMLHVAGLLRPPVHGEVRIGGELATRANRLALRRRLTMVFQDALLFNAPVLANVAAGPRFRGARRTEAAAAAREWLNRFGVAALADRPAQQLSGGEAQRVSLARAFAVSPDVILLDEPFSAIDAASRSAIIDDVHAQLEATGTTAVLVTHDLNEALALGDRIGVLLDGRLVQLGQPLDVIRAPATLPVARLLGLHNLLPATLAAGDLHAETGRGEKALTIPRACLGERPLPPDGPVTIAIMPRETVLAPPGTPPASGTISLRGTVRRVVPTVDGVDLQIASAGSSLIARPMQPLPSLAPGDAVQIIIPLAALHVLAGVE